MGYDIKQMVDFSTSKGVSTNLSDEIKRRWSNDEWSDAIKHRGHYDPTRSHLNFEIERGRKIMPVDQSKTLYQKMQEILAARGIKDPNAGLEEPKYRTVVNFILGGNTNRMRELAFGTQSVNFEKGADNSNVRRCHDIERWALDMYKFACEKWGEENILNFCVHLDETNPHVHLNLLPIYQNKKFSFKKVFGGQSIFELRQKTGAMHSEFASVNEKWGMYRGDSIYETGAKHRTTEEYRRALSGECSELEQQIEEKRNILSELDKDIRLGERRVKGLSTMITNLEDKRTSLESQLSELADKILTNQGDKDTLQRQISKLDLDLQRVIDSIDDKKQKLSEAKHELDELISLRDKARDEKEEAEQERNKAVAKAREASSDELQQVQLRLADGILAEIIPVFRQQFQEMDENSRQLFDNSLLLDIAERGEEVMTCALLGFIGAVDEATTFAETHGGGGSSSDLPWGRKDDESDREFARRCLLNAHKLMRPSGRTVKR